MAKAKKKVKLEAQDIKLEDLEQAVDEVNTQLDLDPGIEKGTDAHMRKELKEAMTDEDLFEGDEEFTSGTYDVLEALGIEHDCVKVKDAVADIDVDEDRNSGKEEEEVVITDVPPKKKQGQAAKKTPKKETKKGETMKTKVMTEKKKAKRIVSKKIITKKKTGTKKQGIGQFVVRNLKNKKFKKLSNQEIVNKVKEEFPDANTTPQNINWYKGKIKKGEL